MNYSIDIKGIHCTGCVNLIKLTLEERGLEDVEVNQDNNIARFRTEKNESGIKELLDKAFKEDLQTYQYTSLNIIN